MEQKQDHLGLTKLPNFRRLYIAGSTSELGSFVTETVIMLFLFKLTDHNKSVLGVLRTSFLISLTIGSILGGSISEYFNRKKILLWCEVIRIPIILSLFFFQDVVTLIICNSMVAFFTGVFRPSRQALINEVVPQDQITGANSLFGSTIAIINLIGPFIGASLFSAFGGINEVLTFDFLTYVLGISLLTRLHYDRSKLPGPHSQRNIFSDTALGFSYIANRADLFAIVSNQFLVGLCIGLLIPLLIPYTIEVLGGTEFQYGIMMSLFGLGGIIGSFLTKKLQKSLPDGKIPYLSIAIEPLLFFGFIIFQNYYTSCFFFFFWGITVFMRITSQMNFISNSVETHFLSRVHSTLELSFFVPNILGGLIVTFIGQTIPTEKILFWAMVSFCTLIYARLPFPHMRRLWLAKPNLVKRNIQS